MAQYIGQVCGLTGPYAPRAFAGWIYDSTKPRLEPATGDMGQDFAFVDFTDHFSSRHRAERALQTALDKLNGSGGEQ